MGRNNKLHRASPWKSAFYNGLSTFFALAFAVLFYFLLLRLSSVFAVIARILKVLRPVICGLIIAYLMNPTVNFLRKVTLPLCRKIFKKDKPASICSKAVSVAGGVLLFVFIVVGVGWLIIPRAVNSVIDLIDTVSAHYNDYLDVVNHYIVRYDSLRPIVNSAFSSFNNWLVTDLSTTLKAVGTSVYSGALDVLGVLKDLFIGLMVAIYLLFSKDLFKAQIRKVLCALFSPKTVSTIVKTSAKTDQIFGGFIVGKLIDSLIIGVLCFIGLTILGFHSCSVLVAVIVGVTNVIPVFGPFIGAIPSALIIWVSQGRLRDCLYFVIFIIILQQLDGNIIGPKILGDSTGLSSFWVIVSIVIFGGFFGVFGMLIGVPCFALLYFIASTLIRRKLDAKGLPLESYCYADGFTAQKQGVEVDPSKSLDENDTLEEENVASSTDQTTSEKEQEGQDLTV